MAKRIIKASVEYKVKEKGQWHLIKDVKQYGFRLDEDNKKIFMPFNVELTEEQQETINELLKDNFSVQYEMFDSE